MQLDDLIIFLHKWKIVKFCELWEAIWHRPSNMFRKVDRRNIQGSRMPQKHIMELFVIAVSVLTEKISVPVKVKLYRMRKTGNKQEDTKIWQRLKLDVFFLSFYVLRPLPKILYIRPLFLYLNFNKPCLFFHVLYLTPAISLINFW